jgi:hypothetical protein
MNNVLFIMLRVRLAIFFLLILSICYGQERHKITVCFLHGSKPYREQRRTEMKQDGGYYGGHVSIIYDSIEFGFTSGKKIKLFPRAGESCGYFYCEELKDFMQDTAGVQNTVIEITITNAQHAKLKSIIDAYLSRTPYCYAFFGMRCASATYDVLSQIGIFKIKSRSSNIISNFYPKLLRKRMKRLAKKEHYRMVKHKGKKTRIWEEDED